MKTKLLLLAGLLIILLSGCSKVDATKIDKVPEVVLNYVQQPDSLVKDTILSTEYNGGYDYVISNKKVVRAYNTDYKTDAFVAFIAGVVVAIAFLVLGVELSSKP